jgi:hypothetical protein
MANRGSDQAPHGQPSTRDVLRTLLVDALRFRELARVGLGLILLLCLAIPIAHAVRLSPIVPTLCGFAVVVVIARVRLSHRVALLAILGCFAVHLAVQIFIVQNHFIEPVSDFQTQWNTAIDYAQHGLRVPDSPQTQRAIPFYYPLVRLFGSTAAVYLVANVVLTSLTYLMSVWIARRYFGWPAAAKSAMVLLFGFEAYFANTIPSHDIFGSFGVVLFLFLLAELEALVRAGRFHRARTAMVAGLAVLMALTITWVEWQRGMGMFCVLALLFYGLAAVVQRAPGTRVRIAIAIVVCVCSALGSAALRSRGLSATELANTSTSFEMGMVVFGSEEGNGRHTDWYRNYRVVAPLSPDQVTALSRMTFLETLRTNPGEKYANYLDRQLNFLRSGQDSGWYLSLEASRWLSEPELRKIYRAASKRTPPVWWAIGLLVALAAILRRDVLFDPRTTPLILVASFMAIMGLVGETQSRYALFMVFLWPIYAGSPFLVETFPARWLGRPDATTPGSLRRAVALRVARAAITVAAIVSIPLAIVWISPAFTHVGLVNFDRAEVRVSARPGSSPGALPQATTTRNLLIVSDADAGSEATTVTVAASVVAKRDGTNALHFVLANELGPDTAPDVIPGRALRVVIDGVLVQTIDLSTTFGPRAVDVPGFAEGDHDVTLELDLGGTGARRVQGRRCELGWTAATTCTHTTIGYLGFY